MINWIKSIPAIKNNSQLSYWYRCIKYRNNHERYNPIANINCIPDFFHVHSYGNKNKDKFIYHIIIEGEESGFFAIYRSMLQLLYVCFKFDFIPYIEIRKSHYNDKENDNVFDFFFIQQYEIKYNQVMQSHIVIDSVNQHRVWFERDFNIDNDIIVGGYKIEDEGIKRLALINRSYIVYKPEIRKKIDGEIEKLLKQKKTIGIHYRGNAFNAGLKGHPIPLVIDDFYDYIDECIENGYEQIFVATDVAYITKKLENRYPGKIKYYSDVFRSNNGIDIHEQRNNRENNGYQMAYEVLRDMNTLASCNALICGNSQVTIAVRIEKESRKEKFEYLKIIDKGINKKDNTRKIKSYTRKRFIINKRK